MCTGHTIDFPRLYERVKMLQICLLVSMASGSCAESASKVRLHIARQEPNSAPAQRRAHCMAVQCTSMTACQRVRHVLVLVLLHGGWSAVGGTRRRQAPETHHHSKVCPHDVVDHDDNAEYEDCNGVPTGPVHCEATELMNTPVKGPRLCLQR